MQELLAAIEQGQQNCRAEHLCSCSDQAYTDEKGSSFTTCFVKSKVSDFLSSDGVLAGVRVNSLGAALCHGCTGLADVEKCGLQTGRYPVSVCRTVRDFISLYLDLENGAPPPSAGQQRAAEQKSGKSISAFSSSAPAAVPNSGYYSLPRSITVANGASDSKATVGRVEDPVPVDKSSQDMAKEDGLDQANTRSLHHIIVEFQICMCISLMVILSFS